MLGIVDNILDMRYFRTLLPMLAEDSHEISLFYEVKANLSLEQVQLLAAAGVHQIQPGIESLSDHVLVLMSKGTTMLQNVRLLKWCSELGVRPLWNLLYGFPGEDPADYDAMLPVFDAIDHLEPPGAFGPVRLDRFSPYHEDPASFGIGPVEPMAPYRYLYPFGADSLRRIAYYFDFAYADGREPVSFARPVLDRVQRWMDTGPSGGLWVVFSGGDPSEITVVRDRPGSARRVAKLAGWHAAVYLACDAITSVSALERVTREARVDRAHLREFLEWCVAERLMLASGDRYLALAVQSPPRSAAAENAGALVAAGT
jgi:ribosomal peptide maturation radical SAM protein 1